MDFRNCLACFELISSSFTWHLSLARACLQLHGQSSRVPGERLFARRCQRRTRMAKTHLCIAAVLLLFSTGYLVLVAALTVASSFNQFILLTESCCLMSEVGGYTAPESGSAVRSLLTMQICIWIINILLKIP